MNFLYELPFFAKTSSIIAIFFGFLVAFHVFLVWIFPLGKRAWKMIDYLWLGTACLGLIGAVEAPRNIVSSNFYNSAIISLDGYLSQLNQAIHFGAGPSICRTFVRTSASPPEPKFSNTQREYNSACSWFRSVESHIPTDSSKLNAPLDLDHLPPIPELKDTEIQWAFERIRQLVRESNLQLKEVRRLEEEKRQSKIEEILKLFGPVLLAIALALRITKVTGEIKNDDAKR